MTVKLTDAQRRALAELRHTTDDYYGCKMAGRSLNARYDVIERLVAMGLAGWTKGVMRGVHITDAGRTALEEASR